MPRSSWLEKVVSLSVLLAPLLAACSFGGSDGDGEDHACYFAFNKLCGLSYKDDRIFIKAMEVLDTSKDESCSKVIPADDATGAPELCVVSAALIEVAENATLRATGTRPLVLAASENIRIRGTLDVSSTRARTAAEGAAASEVGGAGGEGTCTPFQSAAVNSADGGSGGAGGSFAGRGGNGGRGNTANTPTAGGTINLPVDTNTLALLRGGCRGQLGGSASNNPNGGAPGSGGPPGGVVYLASRGTIQIVQSGKINASGGGGGGGGAQAGGGGGGSGGLIILEALTRITHVGLLTANGGGGGGGGQYDSAQLNGTPGSDGKIANMPAEGGNGQAFVEGEGDGGRGAANDYTDAELGKDSRFGGGGGGGGVGWIHLISPSIDNRGMSSPPTQ